MPSQSLTIRTEAGCPPARCDATTLKRIRHLAHGFSLIELLVVIAIVSIVAALLFPAFARARASSEKAACISNMRQIAFGILMYSDDFDERCPTRHAGIHVTPGSRVPGLSEPAGPPDEYWPELIAPYIQRQPSHDLNTASRVFICPIAHDDAAAVTADGTSNVTSYGLSDNWADWYCPDDCNNGTGQAHSFAEAVAPASTVLIAETKARYDASVPGYGLALTPIDGGNVGYAYADCDRDGKPAFAPARMFDDLSWRHTSSGDSWCDDPPVAARVNVAWSDGHASSPTLSYLSDFRRWAIFQGSGDVGHRRNIDGEDGYWFP